MRTYTIRSALQRVPPCGDVEGAPWREAEVLAIDQYPWYEAGRRQATHVRLLYDAEAIYVQYLCEDRHIFAQVTELNGPVCTDSCVEIFVGPGSEVGADYFNLEINCCGTMLMKFGSDRRRRILITADLASRVRVATSVTGPTKDESPSDDGWWAAVAVPFEVLSKFAGLEVAPKSGDTWRANFYRCGGKTDPQYACWNPIDWPQPDFHRPDFFGELRFA